MLANYDAARLVLRRSQVVHQIRHFLNLKGFAEVQTPILSSGAGGATARPFKISTTGFSEKHLSLRVAPELWLKRLILGGMDRIFEIGPCFRDEGRAGLISDIKVIDAFAGLDRLHNPEFTTCEFYSTYTSIQDLLEFTENMLNTIVRNIEKTQAESHDPRSRMPYLALESDFFEGPYPQLDYILALSEAISVKLPHLGTESAMTELSRIFREKEIALPVQPTLPRLLDKLSAIYLEPQCDKPTWIVNHPECLSPLSKSYFHPSPDVAQPVAARAELFIHRREIVNCYEEENSPFEQRRKFMMQQKFAEAGESKALDEEPMEVDERYLQALEWGLPPTGGWGCGIDRLVMLLTGKQRISDVLTFGNLKSVTRIPESREMVKAAALPAATIQSQTNHDGVPDARKELRTDNVQAERPCNAEHSKPMPQLDAPEEAVLKIQQKLKPGRRGRSTSRKGAYGSSSAEQKRLAIWLAGRGGADATEWLLDQ